MKTYKFENVAEFENAGIPLSYVENPNPWPDWYRVDAPVKARIRDNGSEPRIVSLVIGDVVFVPGGTFSNPFFWGTTPREMKYYDPSQRTAAQYFGKNWEDQLDPDPAYDREVELDEAAYIPSGYRFYCKKDGRDFVFQMEGTYRQPNTFEVLKWKNQLAS